MQLNVSIKEQNRVPATYNSSILAPAGGNNVYHSSVTIYGDIYVLHVFRDVAGKIRGQLLKAVYDYDYGSFILHGWSLVHVMFFDFTTSDHDAAFTTALTSSNPNVPVLISYSNRSSSTQPFNSKIDGFSFSGTNGNLTPLFHNQISGDILGKNVLVDFDSSHVLSAFVGWSPSEGAYTIQLHMLSVTTSGISVIDTIYAASFTSPLAPPSIAYTWEGNKVSLLMLDSTHVALTSDDGYDLKTWVFSISSYTFTLVSTKSYSRTYSSIDSQMIKIDSKSFAVVYTEEQSGSVHYGRIAIVEYDSSFNLTIKTDQYYENTTPRHFSPSIVLMPSNLILVTYQLSGTAFTDSYISKLQAKVFLMDGNYGLTEQYSAEAPGGAYNDTIYFNEKYFISASSVNSYLGNSHITGLTSMFELIYNFTPEGNQISIGGAWKEIKGAMINIGNSWKPVKELLISINNQWVPIQADTTRPTDVTNLSLNWNSTDFQSELSWTAATDNVAIGGYQIWRSIDGTNYLLLASVSGNLTSFTDLIPVPSKTNYYKVRAFDTSNNFSLNWSNVVNTAVPDNVGITLDVYSLSWLNGDTSTKTVQVTTDYVWQFLESSIPSWITIVVEIGYSGDPSGVSELPSDTSGIPSATLSLTPDNPISTERNGTIELQIGSTTYASLSVYQSPPAPAVTVIPMNFTTSSTGGSVNAGSTTLHFDFTPNVTGLGNAVLKKNGTQVDNKSISFSSGSQYNGTFSLAVAAAYGDYYDIEITKF